MAYILVLDQGTTSSRATVYNEKGEKNLFRTTGV